MKLSLLDSSNNIDRKWIEHYKSSNDLDALSELYIPYMPLVYGVSLKYLKDKEKSKDMVMEIFELLVNKLKFQNIGNFRAWLYVTCKNQCLMQLRKKEATLFSPLDGGEDNYEALFDTDNPEDRENQLLALENCMKGLNEEQKNAVILFYFQQKCYKEIADITGADLKKVKSHIQNGKRNLKLCIEDKVE